LVCRIHDVAHVDTDYRTAIAGDACAFAAGMDLIEGQPPAVFPRCAEDGEARSARAAGSQAFGTRRREGPPGRIDNALAGVMIAADDRAVRVGLADRSRACNDLDWPVASR